MPGPDPFSPLLEKSDRLGPPARQCIGKQSPDGRADHENHRGPLQGRVNRRESFGKGLLDHDSPVETGNRSGRGNLAAIDIAARCGAASGAADRITYGPTPPG